MSSEGTDSDRDRPDIRAALSEALAGSGAAELPETPGSADYAWLRIGLRLGIEQPEDARRLLALIEASTTVGAPGTGDAAGEDTPTVDYRSALIARSATLPLATRTESGGQSTFSWVAALAAGDILAMGRVVDEMLTAGSAPDIGRGFGLAWDAGVRLPREELEAMIGEFAELQVMVGGLLAGRDLRTGATERRRGLSGLFDPWLARTSQTEAQASAVIQSAGGAGERGLVALWNTWVGLRYQGLIPRPTFDLLVEPWRTVMGPLPGDVGASESPTNEGTPRPR